MTTVKITNEAYQLKLDMSTETLKQAVDMLARLADGSRLIGVISHVSELKLRIDQKLVIRKGPRGSYVDAE